MEYIGYYKAVEIIQHCVRLFWDVKLYRESYG